MSLFSGFSTAGDEERAIRLSRLMTEKSFQRIAVAVRLHSAGGQFWVNGKPQHTPDGEPLRTCKECIKPWPCPTWVTLTGEDDGL